jgi:hypothetical protein
MVSNETASPFALAITPLTSCATVDLLIKKEEVKGLLN